MVAIPLGIGAYQRSYGGEPEVELVNRFVEANPTNLREHIALLTRPGTDELSEFAGGGVRGTYSKQGLFNGDLFVVSGPNLYRYATDGTQTHILGIVNNSGHPEVTWMKGIGYEYLFIADGLLLQFYGGGTHAAGTLTKSGAITNQVIKIGTTYYSWNAAVDTNAPDGTAVHPWLANPGTDPIDAMTKLINFDGVRGVDFSTTLGGPSPLYTAASTGGPPATAMVVTAVSPYADGNAIATTVVSGANLAWGAATLTGGNVHVLQGVPVPDGLGIKALANLSSSVLASVANSQKVFFILPGDTTIDPLNFFEKESNPDNVVHMLTVGDQVLITGQGSTENWYATGDSLAPFAPQEGRVYARGTVDGSAVVVGDSVILVGDDGKVYEIGYSSGSTADWGVHRISDHGIEERIRVQLRREQGIV